MERARNASSRAKAAIENPPSYLWLVPLPSLVRHRLSLPGFGTRTGRSETLLKSLLSGGISLVFFALTTPSLPTRPRRPSGVTILWGTGRAEKSLTVGRWMVAVSSVLRY